MGDHHTVNSEQYECPNWIRKHDPCDRVAASGTETTKPPRMFRLHFVTDSSDIYVACLNHITICIFSLYIK
jgi:hypothetical protein